MGGGYGTNPLFPWGEWDRQTGFFELSPGGGWGPLLLINFGTKFPEGFKTWASLDDAPSRFYAAIPLRGWWVAIFTLKQMFNA